jgi:hypothetical protein
VAGCSTPGLTQLIVVVDTDLHIPAEIDHLEIDVTPPSHQRITEAHALAAGQMLPITLTVVPSGEVLGPIDIDVIATHGATTVITRRATVTLVRNESRVVLLHLSRSCLGVMCPAGQTCGESGCVPVAGTPLYVWMGTPPRLGADAGAAVDGGHDAGPVDAGSSDAHTDTGPLPDGGADCTMTGCDDMNPCTDDVCNGMHLCEHRPADIACDDGTFCNGLDTCSAGACTVHVGNPCVGSTVCDETANVCTGCTSDANCPAQMTGAWSGCGGFSGLCGNDGSQSRMVRTFSCMAGSCVSVDSTQMQACTRDTTGMSCGGASCDGFGGCSGFSEPCGTSGSQSRTCYNPVCSGGACTNSAYTDTQGCGRATDGASCGAAYCDGWGACGGFADTCATNGSQSRLCHAPTCSGGGCGDATHTETQGCTRSTDGASCGGPECGTPACTGGLYSTGPCDGNGYEESSCRDRVCGGGACGYGAYYTMNGAACSISTDWNSCYAGSGCDYCYSGYCNYGGC